MKTTALLMAMILATLIMIPPASASGCQTSHNHTDVAGVFYIRTAEGGSNDGEDFFYLETNGVPSLQYGSQHEVFGWSELDNNGGPCDDGDLLVL